jgi:hypothetical protein
MLLDRGRGKGKEGLPLNAEGICTLVLRFSI